MTLVQKCQLCCAVCKILCYKACCCCIQSKVVQKKEFQVLALGLTNSGKSTLIAKLCNEPTDMVVPTTGFAIKDVVLGTSLLHIKEVGGSPLVRKYWHHYFSGNHGLIYVIDAEDSEEAIELAIRELRRAVNHPSMTGLPVLVLLNKSSGPNDGLFEKVSSCLLDRDPSDVSSYVIDYCNKDDVGSIITSIAKFSSLLEGQGGLEEHIMLSAKGGTKI